MNPSSATEMLRSRSPVPHECDYPGQATQPQWQHDPPLGRQLLDPRRRDVPRAGSNEDSVERSVLGRPQRPVAGHHPHTVSPVAGQVLAGGVGDLRVELDRCHQP
jgi:hypothetical protein